jgi:hypothetical protein
VSNLYSYQDNSKIAFKSEELDFFDPELSEKYSTDNLIYSGKNELIQQIESRLEVENVIEIKKEIIDENFSEDSSEENRYYADKIGKYYRNCNSIFGSENKLY